MVHIHDVYQNPKISAEHQIWQGCIRGWETEIAIKVQCFSGCLSTQCTFKFGIDQ